MRLIEIHIDHGAVEAADLDGMPRGRDVLS